jgi:hypothetical protein
VLDVENEELDSESEECVEMDHLETNDQFQLTGKLKIIG